MISGRHTRSDTPNRIGAIGISCMIVCFTFSILLPNPMLTTCQNIFLLLLYVEKPQFQTLKRYIQIARATFLPPNIRNNLRHKTSQGHMYNMYSTYMFSFVRVTWGYRKLFKEREEYTAYHKSNNIWKPKNARSA